MSIVYTNITSCVCVCTYVCVCVFLSVCVLCVLNRMHTSLHRKGSFANWHMQAGAPSTPICGGGAAIVRPRAAFYQSRPPHSGAAVLRPPITAGASPNPRVVPEP